MNNTRNSATGIQNSINDHAGLQMAFITL